MHKTTGLEPNPNGALYLTLTHQASISRILIPLTKAGLQVSRDHPSKEKALHFISKLTHHSYPLCPALSAKTLVLAQSQCPVTTATS